MAAAVKMQAVSKPEQIDSWANSLTRAVGFGDFSSLEAMLSEGADIDAATPAGTTLLMSAASFGQLAVVRSLLRRGANVNIQRSDGFSALLFAVFFGHEEIVRELIFNGADISAQSRGCTSARMWASTRCLPNIEDILREVETHGVLARVAMTETHAAETAAHRVTELQRIVRPSENVVVASSGEAPRQEAAIIEPESVERITDAEYTRKEELLIESAGTPSSMASGDFAVAHYSPFSVMAARMKTGWKYAAVIILAFLGLGTLTAVALRAVKARSAATVTETKNVPASEYTALPAQQAAAEHIHNPAVNQAEPTAVAASENPATAIEDASKEPTRVEGTATQHSRVAGRWQARAARLARAANDARNERESDLETATPAPVTIVTKQPPVRKTTPADVPALPSSPIEGSSTKKKVIQWP